MLQRLIQLFIRTNGRNPNKLEMLQLRFKAAQQAGKGEVIEFPPSAITDWTKARPTTGKKADVVSSGIGKKDEAAKISRDDKIISDFMASAERTYGKFVNETLVKVQNAGKDEQLKIAKDIINRKGMYRNLDDQDAAKILKSIDQNIKPVEPKAGGGIAGMLGEPTYQDEDHRVPYKAGKKVWDLLGLVRSKFGPESVTTANKLTRPTKAIEAEKTKKMFDDFNNKIATQEALAKGSEKMAGPIKTKNKKGAWDPESTDHTTWLQQEKYFDPKALDMYGKKVPSNWIEVEKKSAQKLIDDLGPLDVSPNHPNYKDMKAIRQSAKDRLESIKITEALGGNIKMHDYLRMERKNLKMSDYIRKEGTPVVKDELSGIKKAFIEKKSSPWFKDPKTLTPEEELRREFPGIDDNLIKNILADKNPQRIAEVKATLHEALKMQQKGMSHEEIINIFKKKPTKHATGGLAGMLGE